MSPGTRTIAFVEMRRSGCLRSEGLCTAGLCTAGLCTAGRLTERPRSGWMRSRSPWAGMLWAGMLLVAELFVAVAPAAAQTAAAPSQTPLEPPEVLLAVPFAVPLAAANADATPVKVVLRGLRLDNPTEVRVSMAAANSSSANVTAKILSSGMAAVPDKLDAKRVGDRQVEIALTMPSEWPSELPSPSPNPSPNPSPSPSPADRRLELRVVTAAGVSQPYRLLVDVGGKAVEETEPNDGFAKAQAIDLASATPIRIDGGIHEPRNVDVFRFEGRAGERLRGELIAARQGGPLDAFATLFDESGNIVWQADDADGGADPRWDAVLPRTGRYFLSLQDAHDRGSVLHRYRLVMEKR